MKLQPSSRKELKVIAAGTLACSAVMVLVFVVLHVAGVYRTALWQVVLSALVGSAVAILNFAALCLTVQKAAEKSQDARFVHTCVQTSYTARLALQALWCIAAFVAPCFQVVAAALPLLFPRVAIYFQQIKERKRPEAAPASAAQQGNPLPPEQER
ncbi:MAG: ATP synthase subunit I [Gemmiger sp.]|uniref:ATP synthase subunit I n=1 Tax=Gemmiger sp. TaxID=2049027 RepID=UPI002E7929D3|nr:ATP synthase subunit I [Gemmiger sp.]MEE0800806.1 ATP synthase subunit I [Gemmiger sp.]